MVTDLGKDPVTGRTVTLKGTPRRANSYVVVSGDQEVPLFSRPEDLTLDHALRLLSLPRVLATDSDGVKVFADTNDQYGPHISYGDVIRQLRTEEQIFTITLREAIALLRGRRQRTSTAVRKSDS
ncbi:topoisomerase C-terminal repeat-containing protein [Actinoplanes sp. NPDC020271]|uniref:topoisomerase C-terminal repeat-containing protein n=1 Tax=Actinoplanes sp. NPDC020271 TaxID=3363896 RepID=UPI0037A0FD2B